MTRIGHLQDAQIPSMSPACRWRGKEVIRLVFEKLKLIFVIAEVEQITFVEVLRCFWGI